jgi:hypothetical protein
MDNWKSLIPYKFLISNLKANGFKLKVYFEDLIMVSCFLFAFKKKVFKFKNKAKC